MRKFIILSIDGGGIRGIIPSIFLSTLKDLLEKRGLNKPFHHVFDLMAGTSTGGLISLALSVPLYKEPHGDLYDKDGGISPKRLPELYRRLGDRVFPGNRHMIRKTLRQVFTSKYSATPFFAVLKELFKSCTVKEALTNVLITTFDMESMQPLFIKKRPSAAGGDTDPDFYMVDAALSTAAVPTYFPPAYVGQVNVKANQYCLIDGGIFCINPAMSALTDARKIQPEGEYIILSLGTGTQTEDYKIETIKRWGFFSWVAPWLGLPLITAVGEGQRISTSHMLKKYPKVTLYRLDVELDKGKGRIDDGSAENYRYLSEKADEMIRLNWDKVNAIASALVAEHKKENGKNFY